MQSLFFNEHWPTAEIALKLLMAIACGGAVGFERELSRKAAGLRTNVLICMGAALYMIISRHISGGAAYTDPARLAAQVVTGIRFFGAGGDLPSGGSRNGPHNGGDVFGVGRHGNGFRRGKVWI